MGNQNHCPDCGVELPPQALVCPICLLRLGLEQYTVGTEDETLVDANAGDPLAPGGYVGPYEILSTLGEGGMGIVFLAEQRKPIERRVALKVIKLGMDTRQVIARFEAERQALALMDHPYVARALDADSTESGRPYFVMEFVQGIPITEYCDTHRLGTRERLELFAQVCEGVHHAHQKGIIHRDIKPSNVLVEVHNDRPHPKIIDFGVAKATRHRLSERTLFTEQGQLIGTPEYMSPEQAEMSGLDVDTRTDIYSLGVLLYELLAGATPFDPKQLRQAGIDEIRRCIREETPQRPSARISTLGDDSEVTAQKRQASLKVLKKRLSGDLDWITLKALEKDRTRRYQSAIDLSADVSRHLKQEPVVASPPSATYKFRKFASRHRLGFAASAIAVFALVLGLIGLSVGLIRAQEAEHIAAVEAQRANREAETAREVSDFLEEILQESDPLESATGNMLVREVLDRGVVRIHEELDTTPQIQTSLLTTMGRAYASLGLYEQAQTLLEEAVQTGISALGSQHPQVAESKLHLGWVYFEKRDRTDLTAARLFLEDAAQTYEAALGPDHPDLAESLHALAVLHLEETDEYDFVESLLRRGLQIVEANFGANDERATKYLVGLGNVHYWKDEHDLALPLYERALAILQQEYGPDHLRAGEVLERIADTLGDRGQPEDATLIAERVLSIREKSLGPSHPEVAQSLKFLGWWYRVQDDLEESVSAYKRALEIGRGTLPVSHPIIVESLAGLVSAGGLMYSRSLDQGKPCAVFAHAWTFLDGALGPEDPSSWKHAIVSVALHWNEQQGWSDSKEVANLYMNCLVASLESEKGTPHTQLAAALVGLAQTFQVLGNYVEAEVTYERAMEIYELAEGEEGSHAATVLIDFGWLHIITGEWEEAQSLYSRSLEVLESVVDADPSAWEIYPLQSALLHMGTSFSLSGQHDLAWPLYERYIQLSGQGQRVWFPGEEQSWPGSLPPVQEMIAQHLSYMGDLEHARLLYEEALRAEKDIWGSGDPNLAFLQIQFGWLLYRLGDDEQARNLLQGAFETLEQEEPAENWHLTYQVAHLLTRHPDSVPGLYYFSGGYDESKILFNRVQGFPHWQASAVMLDAAAHFDLSGAPEEAQEVRRRALRYLERALEGESWLGEYERLPKGFHAAMAKTLTTHADQLRSWDQAREADLLEAAAAQLQDFHG